MSDPLDPHIGLSLKLARIASGLRLADVAAAAGVSVALLSLVERGRRRLTPAAARKILGAFQRSAR